MRHPFVGLSTRRAYPNLPMLEAIVFDFDGVLADTEPLHLRAFGEVLAGARLRLEAREYYKRYVGLTDRMALAAVLSDAGLDVGAEDQAALIAAKGEKYRALLLEAPPVFPGVVDKVREWSAAVPLAIASGAFRVEIEAVLRATGLAGCFAAIVTADDCERGKPDPEPFARALAALGVAHPARTVAIEDSIHGLVSARKAGMRTVAVTTAHDEAQLSASADLVVPGVAALSLAALEVLAGGCQLG
jgi:beta-phosphoglucomutase